MNLGNLIAASSTASSIISYTLRQGSSALQGDWISLCTETNKNTYDPLTGYGTLFLLPDIATIGDFANAQSPFYGNTDLLEVDFTRSSIKNIGLNALYGCSSLTIVNLGKLIQSIGENAIRNCTSLQTITIPKSVTSIGLSAFAFDSSLSTVILEAELPPDLGSSAFTSIAGSSTLKVPYVSYSTYSQSIYSSYFTSVVSIESVIQYTATQKLQNNWISANTIVAKNTFDSQTGKGALILKDNITMIGDQTQTYTGFTPFKSNSYVKTVDLSLSNISTLGYRAFDLCSNLTSIDIGPSVTQILPIAKDSCVNVSSLLATGNSTYQASNGLIISGASVVLGCVISNNINIPDTITTIASGAFYRVGRYSAYIPESVTSIGDEAFVSSSINHTNYVYCYATTPPTLGQNNFNSQFDNLYVLRTSLELYQESAWASCFEMVWTIVGVITYVAPSKLNNNWFNNNTTHTYDTTTHTGTLTLKSGDITSFGNSHPFSGTAVSKVDLSKSYFTSLGDSSFSYCSSLSEVILPEGLEEITDASFRNCSALQSINIPSSVTSVCGSSFYGCSSLQSFVFPENVTTIKSFTFYHCSSLSSVTFPPNLDTIYERAFEGTALTSLDVSISSIGNYCFMDCTSLTSVRLTGNLEEIGFQTFYGCSQLSQLQLPNSITTIKSNAFSHCTLLSSVTLPDSVTTIKFGAFSYTALESFTIPVEVTVLGGNLFDYCESLTTVYYNAASASKDLNVDSVFGRNCYNLKNLIFGDSVISIPSYLIEYSTISNVVLSSSIQSIANHGLSSPHVFQIEVPSTVQSVSNSAFANVGNLIYSGSLSTSGWGAKVVNGYVEDHIAYTDSTKTVLRAVDTELLTVNVPSSVVSIGSNAFMESKAHTINISSVETIGRNAFSDTYSLLTIICNALTPPTLETYVFSPTDIERTLYVPASVVADYQASDWATYFTNILPIS